MNPNKNYLNIPQNSMKLIQDYQTTARQIDLQRMKVLAAALFWLACFVFVITSIFEDRYIWIGFVRATAEAAMVGAIADWFAVTALFRYPFGLKIPHTAIIPTRKDYIGQNFGRFVQQNFLSKEVVTTKLRSMDLTMRLGQWLSHPENSQQVADYVATIVTSIIEVINDEDVENLIQRTLESRIQSTQIAPLMGHLIDIITAGNRQEEILQGFVSLLRQLFENNQHIIRQKIIQETPWWMPTPVDEAIYQRVVNIVEKILQEVNADPMHPWHAEFKAMIDRFVERLKYSPDIQTKEMAIKQDLLEHPQVRVFTASLWTDIKARLTSYQANPDLDFRKPVQHGITQFGQAILQDEVLQSKVDYWVEQTVLFVIQEYGHEVEHLIAYTIRSWDTEATSRKIELYVGKDLQFIRINGTIVGGLVGLLIHTVSFLIHHLI